MTEQQKREWVAHNDLLQEAYQQSLFARNQKEKDAALLRIKSILDWEPFQNYCVGSGVAIAGITRYGLDSMTERCINRIDKIAKGAEEDY